MVKPNFCLESLLKCAAVWLSRLGGALAIHYSESWYKVFGVTVRELAYLRLLHERLPGKTPQHVRIFEFLLRQGNYFTAKEIALETGTFDKFAAIILEELAESRLIEKEGCLFRCNGIAMEEIVECK